MGLLAPELAIKTIALLGFILRRLIREEYYLCIYSSFGF